MRLLVLSLILVLALCQLAEGQSDSLRVESRLPIQTPQKPQRKPMGALLRSIAVPGWGQYYNHKYVKSAVIFGAETFFIYRAVHWWIKAEDEYDSIQGLPEAEKAAAFNRYSTHRSNRNDYLWLTGITVFLSMFDAYVDAHLAGFDVDLTPEFKPATEAVSLTATLHF